MAYCQTYAQLDNCLTRDDLLKFFFNFEQLLTAETFFQAYSPDWEPYKETNYEAPQITEMFRAFLLGYL